MWHATTGDNLEVAELNEEWFVYNDLTNDTHVLNAAAYSLLQRLIEEPRDVATLSQLIAKEADIPVDQRLTANIEAYLDHLQQLSLAEPL